MAVDPTDITPTLKSVASRIRTRTMTRHGVELGTFDSSTRPNDTEATEVVEAAARFVALRLGRIGTEWDGDLLAAAKDAVAARAALKIETGFYADGSGGGNTIVIELGQIAREELDAVRETARNNQIGGNRMHSVRIVSANRPRTR